MKKSYKLASFILCVILMFQLILPDSAYATGLDPTPPVLSGTSAGSETSSGATLYFTSSKTGTYYYLVYISTAPAPNADTVMAQGAAVAKGTDTAAASVNTATVTGLSASTAYKAYLIVEDSADNKSAVSTIAFTTTASFDLWDGTAASAFAGGSGTISDPYLIATGKELAYLAQLVNNGSADSSSGGVLYSTQCYKLTSNIDISNYSWIPVGSDGTNCFSGNFEGNGMTVKGLNIGSTGSPVTSITYAGLFGYVKGVINDINLDTTQIYITGGYAGALAGWAEASRISGCSADNVIAVGTVASGFYGGLLGYVSSRSFISGCDTSNVEITGRYAGGLIGKVVENTVVYNCVAAGNVTGFMAAGLVGCGNRSTITECQSGGGTITGVIPNDIDPTDFAYSLTGGIIAESVIMTVNESHSSCDITGGTMAGGLIARAESNTVIGCYATGNVTVVAKASTSAYISTGGGLIGTANALDGSPADNGKTIIKNCCASGSVTYSGDGYFIYNGGLVGHASDTEITDSYSIPTAVYAPYCSGGLVGYTTNSSVLGVIPKDL